MGYQMLTIACCLLQILFLSTVAAFAQGINLAGEWHLHKRKSVPDNVDGRRVPTKLVVEQEENKLAIDRTYDGFFVYEDFTIGGEPNESQFRDAPRRAEADWSADGKSLTISATVIFRWRGNEVEVPSTEIWHLRTCLK